MPEGILEGMAPPGVAHAPAAGISTAPESPRARLRSAQRKERVMALAKPF